MISTFGHSIFCASFMMLGIIGCSFYMPMKIPDYVIASNVKCIPVVSLIALWHLVNHFFVHTYIAYGVALVINLILAGMNPLIMLLTAFSGDNPNTKDSFLLVVFYVLSSIQLSLIECIIYLKCII